ncbi:MAG: DUF3800 domain-containing protein [Gammaproteobacteria bacterium]
MYFDEVKNIPGSQNSYYLGAICISDDNILYLEKIIDDLAFTYFKKNQRCKKTEIHACDIVQGKNNFKGHQMNDRALLYKNMLNIISWSYIEVFYIEIRTEQIKSQNYKTPRDWAIMFLIEKVDEYMKSLESHALLIGDQDDETNKRDTDNFNLFKSDKTDASKGKKIERISDTLFFCHSHHSRLLQLADIYTYTEMKYRNHPNDVKNHVLKTLLDCYSSLDLFPKKYKIWPQ